MIVFLRRVEKARANKGQKAQTDCELTESSVWSYLLSEGGGQQLVV